MRGIVLAGGYGTRMQPATKVANKHLLPVYTKTAAVPMIHFPIRTLVESGIENILIVSSRRHAGQLIEHLGDGYLYGADFSYKVQDLDRTQLGIASALKVAKDYTCDNDLAVILGDNFFEHSYVTQFNCFNESNDVDAFIFIKKVPKPNRFGVIRWKKTHNGQPAIATIEEKPTSPPSTDVVTGLYLFKPNVYKIADHLMPSHRNELEMVDILNRCVYADRIGFHEFEGFWSDMGTPNSMKCTQEFLNE